MPIQIRPCPVCGGRAGSVTFPFNTSFDGHTFEYYKCAACDCVYVDPVPDAATFARMYNKSQYHDLHYESVPVEAYLTSASMLRKLLPSGSRVLDYGCGSGGFLGALGKVGLIPVG